MMMRLGVNVDHVATVRNARGENYPDPVKLAQIAESAGADNITMHLREDRRHIKENDVFTCIKKIGIPLNFEIANTPEMIAFALKLLPHAVTLVPEKRQELTTESGILCTSKEDIEIIKTSVKKLQDSGIAVSLFVEPSGQGIELALKTGTEIVEFHTGQVCINLNTLQSDKEKFAAMKDVIYAAKAANENNIAVHLGHGINYSNAHWMQLVPFAVEANIGHAIVSHALEVGFDSAVKQMKALITDPKYKPKLNPGDAKTS